MTQYVIRWRKMPAYYSYEGKEEGKVRERERRREGRNILKKAREDSPRQMGWDRCFPLRMGRLIRLVRWGEIERGEREGDTLR